ncbi:MAG: triose-phosphate isomerase [Canidatus Methanoxibalbensis ujae]|nr:triose-phosphate isomerase [Candidatus Methanoxibalbensis ujae]MCW7078657.1 triose-phosphate isomerase [Candidatus Methanoxibalbensis ujae]
MAGDVEDMERIETPVIVINVKAYEESIGERGMALARVCEEVASEKGVSIAICPQQVFLAQVASAVSIPCFAQHVDAVFPGSHTGFVTLEAVKASGAVGTLVNHSEHRMKLADIEFIVSRAAEIGMLTIVCTNNVRVSRAVSALRPYSVAVEPPELIGTGRAVSKVDPAIVSDTVKAVKEVHEDCVVLCGAGITSGEDVRAAVELGADGVLLASGVVKAENPKNALLDLVSGI